ncbi:glycosyltransferase [Bacillus sp. ISL-47]|uniref:glycosyltransferase n=1 Tax=Bacillus sp. ISL-47 TaxID=2819130 RepID=UPI001BEA14FC|nr:glycosyltransferase [Bacillus sp. ISL-47]MBT2686887.1 glycosyltransferase [Bacillus sp. ISL-47]MBT2710426.1 glycosyltransferase [Pseudomonas sp. ISL-84]
MVSISIILTSYNKNKTIGYSIESVINQTFKDWELFVMDDNSNEDTVKVIKKYLTDKRIKYFNSNVNDSERYKTTRYATLINEAIPKTKGKYITYLTDDNVFLPNRLSIMINYLEKHPGIEVVYSKQLVKIVDDNGKVKQKFSRRTYGILSQASGFVDHCSVMHTRGIAERVYKIYGSYWDDNPKYWFNGDAAFWNRLTELAPFYPIRKILDVSYKSPDSFQRLFIETPKNIPDGTLLKGPSTDIYLMEGNRRRKINTDVFNKLRYSTSQIVNIPDPFLYRYKEGSPIDQKVFTSARLMPNQRLIKSAQKPEIYYIQNNKKHLIPNQTIFNDYHFQTQRIVLVSDILINHFDSGPTFKTLADADKVLPDGILYCFGSDYYISLQNCLHPISFQTAAQLKLNTSNPVMVDAAFISKFKKGKAF